MSKKGKYLELIQNVGVLTISNFGSKLLSFFLIPLYTAVLSTSDYGNYDFIYTTISLLIPILTLNISEAAMRFLLDKKSHQKNVDICNVTFRITLFSILIACILAYINYYFKIINIINTYIVYFIVYYVTFSLYTMIQNITRGFDKIKILAISGVINSVLVLSLNILFLLIFKIGLIGYFMANIIANGVATVYLLIKVKFFKHLNFKTTNKQLKNEMLNYSKPLMLNSVSWWINNVSDRYVITYICGVAANGIYSVAYKIPSILTIFQNIFTQAWGISAVKEFDKEDKDSFFKNIYISYNILMVFGCSVLIILSKILAYFLCLNEFFQSWKYMPFLLISVIFGALSGLLGGVFSAVKDSKILGITTMLGALMNIVLNIILVNLVGVIGAAIATAISYFVVWIVRIIKVKKYIILRINLKKDFFAYLLLVIQSIILLNTSVLLYLYVLELVLFIILAFVYRKEMIDFVNKILKKISPKEEG